MDRLRWAGIVSLAMTVALGLTLIFGLILVGMHAGRR